MSALLASEVLCCTMSPLMHSKYDSFPLDRKTMEALAKYMKCLQLSLEVNVR